MTQEETNLIKQQTLKAVELSEGKMGPPDILSALPLFVKSARAGDNLASAYLGYYLLQYDDNDDLNYLKLIQDAYNKKGPINHAKTEGDINCLLATCYLNGWGGLIIDKEKVFQLIKSCLSVGGKMPYTYMGLCYMGGIGVVKDTNVALKYFKKGSQEGSALSKYYMAIIEGMNNAGAAFYVGQWIAEAAKDGCALAMVENAIILRNISKFAAAEEMARKAIEYSEGNQDIINRASHIIRDMGGTPPRYHTPIMPEVYFDENGLPSLEKTHKRSVKSNTTASGSGVWNKLKKLFS